MKVKCYDIIANPEDNTSGSDRMNPQDCTGLAQTIERVGQLQPVIVKKEGDKYRLAAGFRRFVAISVVLGWEEIEAHVVSNELNPEEVNAIENFQRKDLSFWEECCTLRKLYPDETPMVEIQAKMGMSKGWVNPRWKAWDLPDEVKRHIEAGILGFSEVLILIQKGVDAEEAAEKLVAGRKTGRTTESMAKDITNRRFNRGRKELQRIMTKCLKMTRMESVQALRCALGEIEEKTFITWLYEHPIDTSIK